jgi:thioredoxin-like negative regulator of GroEL
MSQKTAILIRTKEQIEQFMADEEPFIFYFSSKNCDVCHAVFPKLMNLISDHPIKVAKIDVDEHVEIAGQLLVFTVPTILMLHEGKEILRESRFIDFEKIERILSFI